MEVITEQHTVHTLCLKKNIPNVFSYNSWKHCRDFHNIWQKYY